MKEERKVIISLSILCIGLIGLILLLYKPSGNYSPTITTNLLSHLGEKVVIGKDTCLITTLRYDSTGIRYVLSNGKDISVSFVINKSNQNK
jgi:hypothetical protein